MVFLINTPPALCPSCGFAFKWDAPFVRSEFLSGISWACDCGANFQYVPTRDLLNAADLSGDLRQYAEDY